MAVTLEEGSPGNGEDHPGRGSHANPSMASGVVADGTSTVPAIPAPASR